MHTKPAVAGVTLVYNNARWVCASMTSIAMQTLAANEHIVIDDGSADDSADVIRAYLSDTSSQAQFISHSQNAGICARLNEARAHLHSEFVFFCSDDLFDEDHLERAVSALRRNPKAVGYFCAMEVIDAENEHLGWRRPIEQLRARGLLDELEAFDEREQTFIDGSVVKRILFAINIVGAPSVVMRRSALEAVGPYDESLMFEDYDMWFRLSNIGGWIHDPHASVRYVVHGSNISVRRPAAIFATMAEIVIKHLAADTPSKARKYAAEQIAECAGSAFVASVRAQDWVMAKRAADAMVKGCRAVGLSALPNFASRFLRSAAAVILRRSRAFA